MPATIVVKRTSFFKGPGKTLAFEEHSPGHKHKAGAICGCTDRVIERPAGEPESVQQGIEIESQHQGLTSGVRFNSPTSFWSVFFWDPRPEEEALRVDKSPWSVLTRNEEGDLVEKPRQDHAYFMFSPNRLRIELTLPGYGRIDHFFGNVFLGRQVDISNLYNGHSPSKIVDLSKLNEDDLWVHSCHWGQEAMRVFPKDLAEEWLRRFKDAEALLACVKPHLEDRGDVHVIRAALETTEVHQLADKLQEQLAAVVLGFRQTHMFRLCVEVEQEVSTKDD